MAANTPSLTQGHGSLGQKQLRDILQKVQYAMLTRLLTTGALAIKTGGSAVVKTANTVKYLLAGNLYSKAAADMAALSGTVTNAKFNVYCFFVDASGTLTSAMGTEGATLADVVFPAYDNTTKCMLGFVIINPTGTGNFVGGTTALDDGTVVPNAVYVDTPNVFDPVNFLAL